MLFALFFLCTRLGSISSNYKLPPISYQATLLIGVIVVFKLGTFPIIEYDDKSNYSRTFENLTLLNIWDVKDIGFAFYSLAIKILVDNSAIYFIVTAFIYVLGYFIFARSLFNKLHLSYFLLACFFSFGFASYGVNIIRGGLALSFLLMSFSFYKKTKWYVLFSITAILCHKSMLLPFLGFYVTRFYNNTKFYFYFWTFCLVVSLLNINLITSFVGGIIGDTDERFLGYLTEKAKGRYNAGFRIDFLIYSIIPILVGWYYIVKLKIKDVFYLKMFNTYLVSNAIWLLVIRMAFTDRMAYLSWFILPFILLYPHLKYELHVNQKKWVFIILLGIFSFTTFMYFK